MKVNGLPDVASVSKIKLIFLESAQGFTQVAKRFQHFAGSQKCRTDVVTLLETRHTL